MKKNTPLKKVLISGSNGFIGTHLKNRLISEDYDVFCINRELLYKPVDLKYYLLDTKPDYIFHLAAYGNHYFQFDELSTIKANIECTTNLIESSKYLTYKGLFNFSTTHHNLESSSFYGATKSAGEYLVRAYVQKHNLPIVNIRPYSVYGEYEWNFRFIPTISKQISKGDAITVSDVRHDWIYVEDFIDALMASAKNIDYLVGKSVGIGTGKRISNIEVANTLMKIVGKKVEIKDGIKRSYEIPAYKKKVLDLSSSERNEIEYFNFAKTPLEVGLYKVYNSPNLWLKPNVAIK